MQCDEDYRDPADQVKRTFKYYPLVQCPERARTTMVRARPFEYG